MTATRNRARAITQVKMAVGLKRLNTSIPKAVIRSINSPWMTVEEAAEYVRRGISTVYQWIGERQVPSYKPDGKTLLRREDIDKFLISTKRESIHARGRRNVQ